MRKFFIVLLISLFIIISFGEQNFLTTPLQVESLARVHANEDVNKFWPFLGGFVFGIIAPIYNYVVEPEVPAERLVKLRSIIKSEDDYLIDIYVRAYKDEIKKIKVGMSFAGWGSFIALLAISIST